jgi:hypothetical protein
MPDIITQAEDLQIDQVLFSFFKPRLDVITQVLFDDFNSEDHGFKLSELVINIQKCEVDLGKGE